NDNVGQLECAVPIAPIEHFPFVLPGELLGFFAGAIGEVEPADVAIVKLGDYLFADCAGAENERGAIVELAKNALGEPHARGSDAHGTRAELGFRANALANFERGLKQAVQDGASNVRGVGTEIGFADLAENFRFAKQHRFQAGRNAEEMADGVVIVVVRERFSSSGWTEWNLQRKLESAAAEARLAVGWTPYTSLRLQVERTRVSSRM